MAAKSSKKWDGERRGHIFFLSRQCEEPNQMLHEMVGNMHDNELKLMEILFHQLVSSCVDI